MIKSVRYFIIVPLLLSSIGQAMDQHNVVVAPRRLALTFDPTVASPQIFRGQDGRISNFRHFMVELVRVYVRMQQAGVQLPERFAGLASIAGFDFDRDRVDIGSGEKIIHAIQAGQWDDSIRSALDRLTVEQAVAITEIYMLPFQVSFAPEHVPFILYWLRQAEPLATTSDGFIMIGQRFRDLFYLDQGVRETGYRDVFHRNAISAFALAETNEARWATAELILLYASSTSTQRRAAVTTYENAYHTGWLPAASQSSVNYQVGFQRRFGTGIGEFLPAAALANFYMLGVYVPQDDAAAADIALTYFSDPWQRHLLTENLTPQLQSYFFGRISDRLAETRRFPDFAPRRRLNDIAMATIIVRLGLGNRGGFSFEPNLEVDPNAPRFTTMVMHLFPRVTVFREDAFNRHFEAIVGSTRSPKAESLRRTVAYILLNERQSEGVIYYGQFAGELSR